MKNEKGIIITGATGFIGSMLVDKFHSKGHRVFAIVRRDGDCSKIKGKAEILVEEEEEWKYLETEAETFEEIIFYHLAWQGVNGPDKGNIDVQLTNIEMGIHGAKLAKKIGCQKFLCAGSVAERGLTGVDALSTVPGGLLYAAAKQALRTLLEIYCKSVELPLVWMQFSNVYGEENRTGNIIGYTLQNILNGHAAHFGPAQQLYDLISANDLIEAVYRLGIMETKSDFYFIGSGTPRKLEDYLIRIGQIANREELIKIGSRADDGIRYSAEMFDNSRLVEEIGLYVTESFEDAVQTIVRNWRNG